MLLDQNFARKGRFRRYSNTEKPKRQTGYTIQRGKND